MKQVVTVSPDGTLSGLQHKPGQGLDLRQFGRAEIVRASEVVWNDGAQGWYVEFRKGSGPYDGRVLTLTLLAEADVDPLLLPTFSLPNISDPGGFPLATGALLFADYDDGVKAEIAVLNALRLAGKLACP